MPSKQATLGNAPDFVETLCGIEFLCWVDSTQEKPDAAGAAKGENLEQRILRALHTPHEVSRNSLLCLGLSDDTVNDVSLRTDYPGGWHHLRPKDSGPIELPVWVDHVGAAHTRWRRYEFAAHAEPVSAPPGSDGWAGRK